MARRTLLSFVLAVAMVLALPINAMAVTQKDAFQNGNLSGITETENGVRLVTDTYNKVVWQVSGDTVTRFAGSIGVADATGEPTGAYQDGAANKAYFMEPWDIKPFVNGYAVSDAAAGKIRYIDSQRVYTVEDTNKKVTFRRPTGLSTDKYGQLYISDTDAGSVYRMDRDGHVALVASGIMSPTGLVWTENGIYVVETEKNRILKIADGEMTVFAGKAVQDGDAFVGGYVDGPTGNAMFDHPQYVAAGADGTLYVSDTGNSSVRGIKNGRVFTVARGDSTKQLPTSPRGMYVSGSELLVADNFIGDILTTSIEKKEYSDVKASDWFASYVGEATARGLMNGTSGTEFTPNTNLTRAMFVTIVSRIYQTMDGSAIIDGDTVMKDVAGTEWFAAPVRWAADAGVTHGEDGSFVPNRAISREEVVTMLYRFAKAQGLDVSAGNADMSKFTDANTTSTWAADAVRWACGIGILNGSEGMLMPKNTATRAQAAKMMVAFMDAYKI